MNMPTIELINVTKTFNEGKVLAVDNITLKIDDGDYVFLLGPTGCGKTTTLRMIAGLEEPDSGMINLNNSIKSSSELRKISTMVFQQTSMFNRSVTTFK